MAVGRLPKIIPGYRPVQKRDIPWGKILLGLLSLSVVGGLVYLFFFSPVFVIKEVEIGHTAGVDKDSIRELAFQDALGKNIFLWRGERLRGEILRKYPLVVQVLVYKGLPDTVKIVLQETTPVFNWETQGKSFLIGERGRVIKEGKNDKLFTVKDNKNLPVTIGKKIVPLSFVRFLQDFLQEARKEGLKIDHFEVNESLFDLWAVTADGLALIIAPTRTPKEMLYQFKKAKALFPPHEYIDLRFSHRVFVK